MSTAQNPNDMVLIGALLVGAYLYSRRNMPAGAARPGRVSSMPGSAGNGWQQIGAAAINGFLKSVTSPNVTQNNSPNSYVPSLSNGSQYSTDASQSGTMQDVAADSTDYADWT